MLVTLPASRNTLSKGRNGGPRGSRCRSIFSTEGNTMLPNDLGAHLSVPENRPLKLRVADVRDVTFYAPDEIPVRSST